MNRLVLDLVTALAVGMVVTIPAAILLVAVYRP